MHRLLHSDNYNNFGSIVFNVTGKSGLWIYLHVTNDGIHSQSIKSDFHSVSNLFTFLQYIKRIKKPIEHALVNILSPILWY